jgi:hypothetical protein
MEGDHDLERVSRGVVGWGRQLCPLDVGEATTKRPAEKLSVIPLQANVSSDKQETYDGRH